MIDYKVFFIFIFYNQQFITQGVKAVYNSYFYNYIHSEAINMRKEKIKERKKERKNNRKSKYYSTK